MDMIEITREYLKNMLYYDKDIGVFTWLVDVGRYGRIKAGSIAGHLHSTGYRVIGILGKNYSAHSLAWLYEYGEWPKDQIDHINHKRADNRIENLREVTNQENACNRTKLSNNTSGITGVVWDKSTNKWMSQIQVDGKKKTLGRFDDLEDAIKSRKEAEIKYVFHVNHGN